MGPLFILTERRYAGNGELSDMPKAYTANVLAEDEMVVTALRNRGVATSRVAWCDPSIDWANGSALLFRTTWDYFDRWPEFSAWLERVEPLAPMMNSADVVRWNLDKHYLKDLEDAGVHVVPTAYVPIHAFVPLFELSARRGWKEVVIKPAIAGAARDTYRIDLSGDVVVLSPEAEAGMESEQLWQRLVGKQDMLVQPFLKDVVDQGELSLVWIDGKVTHAVRKRAKKGDFRVQDDHGGTVTSVHVDAALEELATDIMSKTVAFCQARAWAPPLYARVDLMRGLDGHWALSELELVEPELWFRFCPSAADVMADAVVSRLSET